MRIKVVYPDGSWLVGKLYTHWLYRETPGTHHLEVSSTSDELKHLTGKRVAVVIAQVKYFILEYKDGA
jgi:hypothetical protein